MFVAKVATPDLKYPKEYSHGISVIPLTENIDFTDTIILLHVDPEHIIFQENNGQIQVSQATPIKQLAKQDQKWEIIRKECLKTPKYAYYYALEIDKQPKTDTRNAILTDPHYAYLYAKDIDKQPRTDTRNAILTDPHYAFLYTKLIDQYPRNDTRQATLKNPLYAFLYALDIDKQPRTDTRQATLIDPEYAFKYALNVDKHPRNDTKLTASTNSYWNLLYEQFETEYNEKTKQIRAN
jgi:hypothetical protein